MAARTGSGDSAVVSEWSDSVSATTKVLPVPANLTAMATSTTEVSLSWDTVAEAERYDLERMRMDDEVIQELRLPDARTSYVDARLETGEEYMYKVRSVVVRSGMDHTSAWSDAVAVTPMLVAPENVAATAADAVTVELSWDAAVGAGGYRFRWRAGSDSWTKEAEDLSGTTYRHEGRDPDTEYSYEVLSYLGEEESDWSTPAAVVTTPELPAPTGVAVSTTATAVTLAWDAVAVADSYRVWRQEMVGGASQVTPVSDTEFTDAGVTLGVEYMYYVESVLERSGGNLYSVASSTVTATPELTPPENLVATAASANAITLEWDASGGATGYEVRWKEGDGAWSAVLDAGNGTSYRHEGLDPETEYSYQVRAVAGTHSSGWSASDAATTEADPEPEPPAGLTATATSPFAVEVTWGAVSMADRYMLRWRADGEQAWNSVTVAGTSHEDTELAPETTYEYQVQTVRGTESSEWSSSVEVTTSEFSAPANFTAAAGAASVALSWDASPGTGVTYRVRWRLPGDRWTNRQDVTGTTYTVTGLAAGTLYEFRVWAFRHSDGERHRTDAVDTEARTQAE